MHQNESVLVLLACGCNLWMQISVQSLHSKWRYFESTHLHVQCECTLISNNYYTWSEIYTLYMENRCFGISISIRMEYSILCCVVMKILTCLTCWWTEQNSSSCQRMKCCSYCFSTFFISFYFIEDSCYKTEFVVFSFLSLILIFLFFFLQNKPITVLQIIQINTSFTGIPSNIHLYRKKKKKNIKKKNKSPSEITVVRAKQRGVLGCGWTI